MTPVRARVLVLDDDEMMCAFLERSLQRHGFTVSSETSAKDALERLTVEDFDVVVSDLNMEGLDGLGFTQKVIALGLGVPVILMTGSGTMEVGMKAVLAGAWDFLTKPVDAKLLAHSVDRAATHRSLKRELGELRAAVVR